MKSTLRYFVVVAIASFSILGAPWVYAQGPKYEVVSTPICWKTGGVDSNLIRYSLISPSSGQPSELFYINSLGAVINPLGGVMKMGWCCNCAGGGSGPDLNGIYSGSGNVPDATIATLLGQFSFQASGGGYTYTNYMDRISQQVDFFSPGGNRTRTYLSGTTWDVFNSNPFDRNGMIVQQGGSTMYSYGKLPNGTFGSSFQNGSFLELNQQSLRLFSGKMNAKYRGIYNDTISAGIKCDPEQPLDYSYLFPNYFDPLGKFSATWDNSRQGAMVRDEEGVFTGVTDSNGDVEILFSYNFPDTNYRVLVTPEATTRYNVSYHTKTMGGFKVNCAAAAGVSVTISWNAKQL